MLYDLCSNLVLRGSAALAAIGPYSYYQRRKQLGAQAAGPKLPNLASLNMHPPVPCKTTKSVTAGQGANKSAEKKRVKLPKLPSLGKGPKPAPGAKVVPIQAHVAHFVRQKQLGIRFHPCCNSSGGMCSDQSCYNCDLTTAYSEGNLGHLAVSYVR